MYMRHIRYSFIEAYFFRNLFFLTFFNANNSIARAISETTFRGISPKAITLNLTKSQERHLLIFQALMILNECLSL
jgi:hypothetical protein